MFQGLLIVCRCGGHLLSPEQAAPGHDASQHMGPRNVGDESPAPWRRFGRRRGRTGQDISRVVVGRGHACPPRVRVGSVEAMAVRELLAPAAVLHRGLVRGADQRLDLGLESRGPLGVRSSPRCCPVPAMTAPSRTGGAWRRSWCCSRPTRMGMRPQGPRSPIHPIYRTFRILCLSCLIPRLERFISCYLGISVVPLDSPCTEAP